MASEINQILPLALGQLVHQGHAQNNISSLTQASRYIQANAQLVAQIAASEATNKIDDKARSPHVPKRSEASFASQDDSPHQEPSSLRKKKTKKEDSGNLDIVA